MTTVLKEMETAEMKADNRIDAEDIRFCQAHQASYEQSCSFLTHLAQEVAEFEKKQQEILSAVSDVKESLCFLQNFTSENILERLDALHGAFIHKIVEYFSRKYHISCINLEKIYKALIPQYPEQPALYFYCDCISGVDYAELQKKDEQAMAEYQAAKEICAAKIRSLRLSYESVMEQIFVQTGEMSLQEKAVSELKENAHKAAWNDYRHVCAYEQKKNIIVLPTHACHSNAWSDSFELSTDTRSIIQALAYFEYGKMGFYGSFQNLLQHRFFVLLHCIDGQKVKQVRCYKRGRIDIKFTSEAYTQEFVEDYLGTTA